MVHAISERLILLSEQDMRRRFTRFQDDVSIITIWHVLLCWLNVKQFIKENYAIAEEMKAIAEKKGVTPAQLCIAWVGHLGPRVIPMPGSSYVL